MMKTIKQCCVWVLLVAVLAGGLHSVSASAQDISGYLATKAKIRLRQAGLSPKTADNAMWAMRHKAKTNCAFLTDEILGTDGPLSELQQGAAIDIEQYHLCDRSNLNKPEAEADPEPYDKNKDPIYQTKLFFRDHPQEAHDMLARVGVPERVIRNASLILADGDSHNDDCSFDITNAIDDIRENRDIEQDISNLKSEWVCQIKGQDD